MTDNRLPDYLDQTGQQAEHTAWIQAELKRRRADTRPALPHDEVVRRMEARFARWQRRRQTSD